MKPHLFAIALLFSVLPLTSQPQELPLTKIEKVLGTYANTVGCDFQMDRGNIVNMDIDKDIKNVFVALYIFDSNCGGGSGSWDSNLAVLRKHNEDTDKGGIYVLPKLTMPEISGIGLPRFIDRIYMKNGQLWIAGRIHAPKDANNFPTIPVQAQVQLLKKEIPLAAKNKRTIYYWKSSKDFQGL